MARARKKKEPKKGDRIKFTAGIYQGKKGWIDTNQDEMPKMIGVIVEDSEVEEECTVTRVQKTSIKKAMGGRVTCFEDAVLDQNPDIEQMLEKLAQELVKCHVTGGGMEGGALMQMCLL